MSHTLASVRHQKVRIEGKRLKTLTASSLAQKEQRWSHHIQKGKVGQADSIGGGSLHHKTKVSLGGPVRNGKMGLFQRA